jgi:hypothetical protein
MTKASPGQDVARRAILAATSAAMLLMVSGPAAYSGEVFITEQGEIVPQVSEDQHRELEAAIQSERTGGFRSFRNTYRGRLFSEVSEERTSGLKVPVVVLSNRKELENGFRSSATERAFAGSVNALKTLVRDPAGKWYHLEYEGYEADLEITQHCSIDVKTLPAEMQDTSTRSARAYRWQDRTEEGAVIKLSPASYEHPASISLTFVEHNVPCTIAVLCLKDSDERCRKSDFIKTFAAAGRRDLVSVPK